MRFEVNLHTHTTYTWQHINYPYYFTLNTINMIALVQTGLFTPPGNKAKG